MNGKVRLALAVMGGGVAVVGAAALGGVTWAKSASETRLSQTFESHRIDLPVPFPLTELELADLRAELSSAAAIAVPAPEPEAEQKRGKRKAAQAEAPEAPEAPVDPLAGVDLQAIAMERALTRGKHLVEARYACVDCHGKDFGGGKMIDDPMVGEALGPNLTKGKGSRTLSYTTADWDRIVRHGIKPDGHSTVMPSVDFFAMSDQELSDIIAYIGSLPPVDKETPPVTLGPLGQVLMAGGVIMLSAELLPDHQKAHVALPPGPADGMAFGKHLAQVCTGCHHADLSGGPIPGAPPDWPASANLTPAGPLAEYDWDRWEKTMRTGVRADGTELKPPMAGVVPFAQNMTDEELKAVFDYLKSLPATQTQG